VDQVDTILEKVVVGLRRWSVVVLSYKSANVVKATMDDFRAICNRLCLEHEMYDVSEWILNLRNKRKSFRRRRRKDLRVEAILTSTLMEAKSLLKLKLREYHRLWQPSG
jgi:hypothetical protein